MASGKDLCLWSALNFNFYIKASLKTVFLAVPDVLAVRLTLDADFCVRGKVGELHGQQGLQVLGLQELAVVGVILQGKTGVAAQAEILHVSNFILIFVSLKTRGKRDVSGSQPGSLLAVTNKALDPTEQPANLQTLWRACSELPQEQRNAHPRGTPLREPTRANSTRSG